MSTEVTHAAGGPAMRLGRWAGKRGMDGLSFGLYMCLGLLVAIILLSIAMRVFGMGHPYDPSLDETLVAPSLRHLFGTDDLGRDVFARTLYATLTDLQVGAICTVIPAIGSCWAPCPGTLADGSTRSSSASSTFSSRFR
jgi:ABC-type dipeptide/oligopeptide/nickel transport system permease subunit